MPGRSAGIAAEIPKELTSHPVSEIGSLSPLSGLSCPGICNPTVPKCSGSERRQGNFTKPLGNISLVWSFQAQAGFERQTTNRELARIGRQVEPHQPT